MKENKSGWINIPFWAIEEMGIRKAMVYGLVLGLSGDDGYCYPSDKWMAEKLKRTARNIKQILRDLEADGYIIRHTKPSTKTKGGKDRFLVPVWGVGEETFPYLGKKPSPTSSLPYKENKEEKTFPLGFGEVATKKSSSNTAAREKKIAEIDAWVNDKWKQWKKKFKPEDDSKGRFRKWARKLVLAGESLEELRQAMSNYSIFYCQQWDEQEETRIKNAGGNDNDVMIDSREADTKFAMKLGNFFGRDEEWREWTDKAQAEENA